MAAGFLLFNDYLTPSSLKATIHWKRSCILPRIKIQKHQRERLYTSYKVQQQICELLFIPIEHGLILDQIHSKCLAHLNCQYPNLKHRSIECTSYGKEIVGSVSRLWLPPSQWLQEEWAYAWSCQSYQPQRIYTVLQKKFGQRRHQEPACCAFDSFMHSRTGTDGFPYHSVPIFMPLA